MSRNTYTKEIIQDVPETGQPEKHRRLAEVDREILEVQSEKSATNVDFNKQLKDLRKEQKDLLDTLDTGKETIPIEVYDEVDEDRLEVVTKRADNDEILPELTRPMTPEERQTRMGAVD